MEKKKDIKKETEVVVEEKTKKVNEEKVTKKESKKEVATPKKSCKRKVIILIISLIILVGGAASYYFFVINSNDQNSVKPKINNKLPKLPKPELAEGERGELGIDKNVNEKTIDKYLNRDDSVYRDMRMLEDPAAYEAIGGDSYLSGYIKGFEVVPLPYIIPVKNLPSEVGSTYGGSTLFFQMSDGSYVPMYEESMDIVEELFPKDKVIFLMCGGGGYAGMMKKFLVSQGWNEDYIYVVGGYWYYEGKNDVKVPVSFNKYGNPDYDFSDVNYHDIDFTELTEIKPDRHTSANVEPFYLDDLYYGGKDEKFEKIIEKYNNAYDSYIAEHEEYDYEQYEKHRLKLMSQVVDYINKLMKDKKTFIITVYNDIGCGDDDDTIRTKALAFTEKHHIYTYDMGYEALIETDVYKDVKNAPNCIIIKKGKVYTFYYDESDEDLKINKSKEATAKWLQKYILLKEE